MILGGHPEKLFSRYLKVVIWALSKSLGQTVSSQLCCGCKSHHYFSGPFRTNSCLCVSLLEYGAQRGTEYIGVASSSRYYRTINSAILVPPSRLLGEWDGGHNLPMAEATLVSTAASPCLKPQQEWTHMSWIPHTHPGHPAYPSLTALVQIWIF